MKRICKTALFATLFSAFALSAQAGSILIENKSDQKIKVSSIGGKARIDANSTQTVDFKNEENGADINIWWIKNARQLCHIYTPWDRKITVTKVILAGKPTIQCLSRN